MKAVQILIKGKVQGVFFRATALEIAKKLGVSGWIKNTAQGHVEAYAAGEEEALEMFLEWCRQGPPDAWVSDISIQPSKYEHQDGFRITR